MINSRLSRIASAVVAFVLVCTFAMPATAVAEQLEITVDNHSHAADQETLSGLVIDGVDAPKPGVTLDNTAEVSSAEGTKWEIPVLWVADNLELSTEAQEGRSYLPVLVFYLPQGYGVDATEFTVTLSDSLAELFGGNEIVSVYDAKTGITYILPASLRDVISAQQEESDVQWGQSQQPFEPSVDPWDGSAGDSADVPSAPDNRTLVDIYCAQTARDAFTDEDLEFFLDLVMHKLEPQAVELLLDSFPAFRAAADQGQIGREIGLYVYYKAGDKDGIQEHEAVPADALAYVGYDAVVDGDNVKYCYMIGMDLSDLAKLDDDNPVRDSATGKYMLVREGENITTLENTIVHELFHAVMDDYSRTGMLGATDIRNAVTDEKGVFPTQELADLHAAINYPRWFVEGSASSVENIYQFRNNLFRMLRAEQGSETTCTEFYDADGLLYNYLNATSDNESLYFDLEYSNGYDENGNEVDTGQCRYVSGYLATLYLSELAAEKAGEPAIAETEDTISISSERLRAGLNQILERMHDGETLDQVVHDLSPVDTNGKKLYADTSDFEAKFIKGESTKTANGLNYYGDAASLEFTTKFLNYLVAIENTMGKDENPNGSILMDFSTKLESPLDGSKDSYSDFLQIVESNELVESTVPNEVALAGGGKSESGTPVHSEEATKMAAKTAQGDGGAASASGVKSGKPDNPSKASEDATKVAAEKAAKTTVGAAQGDSKAAAVSGTQPSKSETPTVDSKNAAKATTEIATKTTTGAVAEAPADAAAEVPSKAPAKETQGDGKVASGKAPNAQMSAL